MKKLVAPALLAVLMLSGCSMLPFGKSSEASAPVPDDFQQEALLRDLSTVEPELKHPRSVTSARKVCSSILKGASDTETGQVAAASFRMAGDRALTAEQSGRVVVLIKANGFCES